MTDAGQQPEAIEYIEETLAEVRRMIYADSASLPDPPRSPSPPGVRDRNEGEDQTVISAQAAQAALHRLEGRIDQLSQMFIDHLARHHGR